MENRFSSLIRVAVAGGLLAAPCLAQIHGGVFESKLRLKAPAGTEGFGRSVVRVGDADGDGIGDFLVGAPTTEVGGMLHVGSVFLFSGARFKLIRRLDGTREGGRFGISIAGPGDLNGDGFADMVVGAPYNHAGPAARGCVFSFSGLDGSLLYHYEGVRAGNHLGIVVGAAGDVDADGTPDFFATAPDAKMMNPFPAGFLQVYSGRTGKRILRLYGSRDIQGLGISATSVGDVDRDGHADLLVGAKSVLQNGFRAGSVFLFSGADGRIMGRLDGTDIDEHFGISVACAGDLDGDGTKDFLIGADRAGLPGRGGFGAAFVYSGRTYRLLHRLEGPRYYSLFGNSVSGAGDVDKDGFGDFLVAAPDAIQDGVDSEGSVFLYSGADGGLLFRFDSPLDGQYFGESISGFQDSDGDGFPDFLVGDSRGRQVGTDPPGAVCLLGLDPILTASGEELSLSTGGSLDMALRFPLEEAFAAYRVLASAHGTGPALLQGLSVPLAPDALFRDSLHGRLPVQAVAFSGLLDGTAAAFPRLVVPPGSLPAKLIGRTLHFAAVTGNLDLSSVAVPVTFLP